MPSQVVCVSRTLGAGGEEVGYAVASGLGFRYIDEEIVVRAAAEANVEPAIVAEAERRQPLIGRILGAIGSSAAADPAGYTGETAVWVDPSSDYRQMIRHVIEETANEGRVVLVAHAAAHALGPRDGVLRVLVTASPQTRERRVAAARQLSERDAANAIEQSDRERRDYFRRFYDIDEEQPTDYDLIVNTDLLSMQQITGLVVSAATA
jgi:cytidylate kinase